MGDPARFRLFAGLVEDLYPDRDLEIADVAAGKGYLKTALYRRGYRHVTAWDRRKRLAKGRQGQRFELFDYRNAPRGYDMVLGMHPDEGSDHVVLYAVKHRVLFLLCPCCVKPSGAFYDGPSTYESWVRHLVGLAWVGNMEVQEHLLPMAGRNLVLIGRPR